MIIGFFEEEAKRIRTQEGCCDLGLRLRDVWNDLSTEQRMLLVLWRFY